MTPHPTGRAMSIHAQVTAKNTTTPEKTHKNGLKATLSTPHHQGQRHGYHSNCDTRWPSHITHQHTQTRTHKQKNQQTHTHSQSYKDQCHT